MHALIDKLASAIATAEGFFAPGDTPPKRNHNPGDLRASPWLPRPEAHGFVVFGSDAEGIAGTYHQIALDVARGATLRSLVSKWAPPGDGNNTENYIRETARRVGLCSEDFDTPLWKFLEIEHLP